MQRIAIFVTERLADEARKILSDYDVFELEADDGALARCEVLMTRPSRARKETLSKLTKLRMVQTMSAGVDSLDFTLLADGVIVCSNAGAYTGPVAEHAWGVLLGLAKGLHARKQQVVPRTLRGRTLLVLGCGAIGSEVARLSKSLGMKTIGVSRSFPNPELFDEKHGLAELGSVIGLADAVVISLPLTGATRGVISYDILSRAKEHVCMVNVGRGELAGEADLIRWLRERPESRYATDVFWKKRGKESFESTAWELPNFAGTLHISGLPLGEKLIGPIVAAAKNVSMYLQTGEAHNRVDRSEYS
ncbi:MAG: 3-phosphoglycerate dehydrogenase [Thaumarchaeota archaeon]|nr:3-phosphoglycerate dehydrogenase [Nitrososphaerota archaeon]